MKINFWGNEKNNTHHKTILKPPQNSENVNIF